MEQRQLRLGDILDDYCPRERRVTNHAVVAMIGPDVKQTRCTTCDAEHAYKHAKVPRQRRKTETLAGLSAQVAAGAPKRVLHDPSSEGERAESAASDPATNGEQPTLKSAAPAEKLIAHDHPDESARNDASAASDRCGEEHGEEHDEERDEGPVHRPLIRASLPRTEGQQPPARPIPEFTIRQPGGRPSRFRPRHQRGGRPFHGDRSNGNISGGPTRGGIGRQSGGRPPPGTTPSRLGRHHGPGRKRSK